MSEEVKQLTAEDITAQLKPLSENAFLRFFQKIWRWWLGVWYGFCDKHPKLSSIVYMIFFFIVFSEGVTILQFIIMTFLPYAFEGIWDQPFVWPAVALGGLKDGAGNQLFYAIFNEPVKFLLANAGEGGKDLVLLASTKDDIARILAEHPDAVLQASGLGNFIAFEIAVFIAQCVNFPLQRNITYRSHGNPWYQAMWYFIGWLGISIFVNALWGICNPLMMSWNWNEVLIGLIKTVITGGLSMVIFFPIFMIIFPDNNKMAKKAKAKYEKLVADGAPAEKIEKAKAKMEMWENKALKSNTEKDYFKAKSQVNAKVMSYLAAVKNSENAKTEEEKAAFPEKIEKLFNEAVEAIQLKEEKEKAFHEICGVKGSIGRVKRMIVKLTPALKDYLWGGENLKKYFNKQSVEDVISEAWELSFDEDSPSVVASGKFAGRPLYEVVKKGDLGANCAGFERFPVLNKFVDAAQPLSVQVNPNDEYALKNEGQYGKNEMWCILDCAKDAYIYVGFNRGVTREEFVAATDNGTVCELLNRIYVRPGQSFFIPAGTVRAIGAGITLFVIQQNSSAAYRIYDYDRVDKDGKKRQLHVDKAVEVLNFNAYTPVNASRSALIGKCKYFSAYRYNAPRRVGRIDSFCSVTVVEGAIRLGGVFLKKGETAFMSAGESAQVTGNGSYIVTCVEG